MKHLKPITEITLPDGEKIRVGSEDGPIEKEGTDTSSWWEFCDFWVGCFTDCYTYGPA